MCAVEPGRTAAAETILADDLNSALLDGFVALQTGEVVAGHVDDGLAVGELGLGAGGAGDNGDGGEVCALAGRELGSERFWRPFVDEVLDFLQMRG